MTMPPSYLIGRGRTCGDPFTFPSVGTSSSHMSQVPVQRLSPPRGNETCPANCNGVGNCHHGTGRCFCPAGWGGPGCTEPRKRPCLTMGPDRRDADPTGRHDWSHSRCSGEQLRPLLDGRLEGGPRRRQWLTGGRLGRQTDMPQPALLVMRMMGCDEAACHCHGFGVAASTTIPRPEGRMMIVINQHCLCRTVGPGPEVQPTSHKDTRRSSYETPACLPLLCPAGCPAGWVLQAFAMMTSPCATARQAPSMGWCQHRRGRPLARHPSTGVGRSTCATQTR